MPNATAVSLMLLLAAVPLNAQEPAQERTATITAGFGNAMGWFGVQGERYFLASRLSAFAGLGYAPDFPDRTYGAGTAGALGVRGYTRGLVHRGFMEVSVSQLAVDSTPGRGVHHQYGPGWQIGYQFVSRRGITFHVSYGAGRISKSHQELMGGVGIGFTWKRRSNSSAGVRSAA
jgi:hypothetical protein